MECIAIIRRFIIDNFLFEEDEDLKDDTSFIENGIIDSTGVLELVDFVEQTFGVIVEDDEIIPENLNSIQNVSRFIIRKKKNAPRFPFKNKQDDFIYGSMVN